MLYDPRGREINYLRISVTDKCNYRCIYCLPAQGIALKRHDQILRYEAIAGIARRAGELGFSKIRLTGGEPLVRKNIEILVEMLREAGDFQEINLTTNGSLLTLPLARRLKEAGLTRINISLDTLEGDRFSRLTRGGEIGDVFAGIRAARRAKLDPVKINMIIFEETTPEQIYAMRNFCRENGLELQTIKQFSLYQRAGSPVLRQTFDRPPDCRDCNRLRLTADGYLKPCLFSNKEIKVDMDDIEKSIRAAVEAKPAVGTACVNRAMCQIGG
ncbi:MAG: radical SAM protein [Candidatus Krumholzibacteriota bacterium]|nr:radical SAM protein [Candidatus Krumholzibacteriota bacterium]